MIANYEREITTANALAEDRREQEAIRQKQAIVLSAEVLQIIKESSVGNLFTYKRAAGGALLAAIVGIIDGWAEPESLAQDIFNQWHLTKTLDLGEAEQTPVTIRAYGSPSLSHVRRAFIDIPGQNSFEARDSGGFVWKNGIVVARAGIITARFYRQVTDIVFEKTPDIETKKSP